MGKKVQLSISIDEDLKAELIRVIKKYNLANRSVLIEKWIRIEFKKLKEDHGIPEKREIAISR